MQKSYGRLTRWVLSTTPNIRLLTGRDDPENCLTMYSLEESEFGFRDLHLIAPLGVEVYSAEYLGKVEGESVLFATKPDPNSDAYLCLLNPDSLLGLPDFRIGVLTEFRWLDPNDSSKALADLIANQKAKRKMPFPDKKLKVQGLVTKLGFEAIRDNKSRVTGYSKTQ